MKSKTTYIKYLTKPYFVTEAWYCKPSLIDHNLLVKKKRVEKTYYHYDLLVFLITTIASTMVCICLSQCNLFNCLQYV